MPSLAQRTGADCPQPGEGVTALPTVIPGYEDHPLLAVSGYTGGSNFVCHNTLFIVELAQTWKVIPFTLLHWLYYSLPGCSTQFCQPLANFPLTGLQTGQFLTFLLDYCFRCFQGEWTVEEPPQSFDLTGDLQLFLF